MASLIPGYEYDIFISYRHNDNRSGWMMEFVAALQVELAATLKEPVSVYFDTNPNDGLLETHKFNNLKKDPRYWDLYSRTGHKAYDDYIDGIKKK